jgi:ubiquitin carboxyl-terminal hydrolase 7
VYHMLICDLDDVLYDHKWAADDALGLDHPDKRPNKVGAEKGIVMR